MTEASDAAPTRERIRAVAAELYVLRGYNGFSFADIAARIGVTRANIHHHFGTKRHLMQALSEGFAADAEARIAQHWTGADASFAARLGRQRDDLRAFYDRFNPEPGARNVWSPLSRLRLDMPVLGVLAATALERVNRSYDRCLRSAITDAVAAGEFRPHTAIEDVVCVLRATLLCCGPITQDAGNFGDVDALLAALHRTLQAAWGTPPLDRNRPPATS